LEIQIIGPRQAEILQVQGIETPRKTIKIPIPPEMQNNGGSFEIALGA
jgi:nucleoporin POM152